VSQSTTFGPGGVHSAETFGFGGISTHTVTPFGYPLALGAGSSIQLQPDPAATSCSVSSRASSRLTWQTTDLLGLPPAATSSVLLSIYFDGSIQQPLGPGGALMSVGVSLIDLDGNPLAALGSMDCGVLGCSSSEFSIAENSSDASGPGFRGRVIGVSTSTVIFPVLRSGDFSLRVDLVSSGTFSGIAASTAYIVVDFLHTLSYEIVSLDPDVTIVPVPIPEPAAVGLVGLGLGILAWLRRRRS
jgi:hypothetical protein